MARWEIYTAAHPILKIAGKIRYQAFSAACELKKSKPTKMHRNAGATNALPK